MLRTKDSNGSGLRGLKRSFSSKTADKDSDELREEDWPASQTVPQNAHRQQSAPKPTMSAAASRSHWGTKSTVTFTKASAFSTPIESKSGLVTKREMPWDNLDPPPKRARTAERGAFHILGGTTLSNLPLAAAAGSSSMSARTMTSTNLSIRQKVGLSNEQQAILSLVVDEGKSVFFTGSAGTGKSVLLREIIAALKSKYKRADAVAITASTGMAACNIGGTTLHSFGGIGIATEAVDLLIGKVKKNKKALGRWQRANVLVIDEVSMVDGDLFDKLAAVAAAVRKDKTKPFGGLQLVVTGDFFQLPPVNKGKAVKFAFEASQWRAAIHHTVNLTQVFRQKDTEFIDMLNEMRFGQLSQKSIDKFKSLERTPKYPDDGIEPTELFCTREQVDNSNQSRLGKLSGEIRSYKAEDSGDSMPEERAKLLSNMMAPEKLTLRVGAQVMLIKNKDETLVNGTTGQIVKFAPAGADGKGIGMDEFDAHEEAAMQDFNDGDHEFPMYREPSKVYKEDPKLKKTNVKSSEDVPWVTWVMADGRRMAPEPLAREEFKVEQGDQIKARRKQFPIILAWAVSIHKSQGQTLARVKVDLKRVFEAGQTYVALSRATSMDALQVLNFHPSQVRCHPTVVAWSKTLTKI